MKTIAGYVLIEHLPLYTSSISSPSFSINTKNADGDV